MHHLLVRHKVQEFKHWKSTYDAHLPTRERAGLKEVQLLRNLEDLHEVIIVFEAADMTKARQFAASSDLRTVMSKAGVTDKPDIYFLESCH
jgi:hypothetical protein